MKKKKMIAAGIVAAAIIVIVILAVVLKSLVFDGKIQLDKDEITLDMYERTALNAELVDMKGEIAWSVKDSDVAIVEDGMVIAVGEGTTTITAKAGIKKAKCSLTVIDTKETPQWDLDEAYINLYENDIYKFYADVTYKNKEFPYCDLVLSSSDTDVIAVDSETDSMHALSLGNAQVKVELTYLDKVIATQDISVEVVENYSISFNVKDNVLNLVLNAFDKMKYQDTFRLVSTLAKDGQEIVPSNLTVTIEDEGVCKYDPENGSVRAVGLGTTTLSASMEKEGQVYAGLLTVHVKKEMIEWKKEFLAKSGDILDLSVMGIKNQKFVSVQDVTSKKTVDMSESTVNKGNGKVVLKSDERGERKIKIETAEKEYYFTVVFADVLISTPDEFEAYLKEDRNELYAVLTQDIIMDGDDTQALNDTTWKNWYGGVLDGRGHIISNFTSKMLFGPMFIGAKTRATLKNIGLDFIAYTDSENYSGALAAGTYEWVEMENVWANITIQKSNITQGVFARFVSDLIATNCVLNINVEGEGSAPIYADYSGLNDTGQPYKDSVLTNVYVVSSAGLQKHADRGFQDLNVVKSASGIKNIGGAFSVKGGALYFFDRLVLIGEEKTAASELPGTYYLQASNPVIDLSALSVKGDIVAAYIKGKKVPLQIENNKLTITGATKGTTTIILETTATTYSFDIFLYDKAISSAKEFKDIIESGLTNNYVILTQDIDMGGIQLAGPVWTQTAGLTIDGCGHGIVNFSTQNMFGIDFQKMTFKNLMLDFKSLAWAEQYSGMFSNGGADNVTMENVYIKVEFEKANFSRGLFASRPSGMNLKNVIVDVTLCGVGSGKVYADFNNFAGAGGDMTADSTLENVYVLCNTTLSKKSDVVTDKYGWNRLVSGNSVNDIQTIGGAYHDEVDGLYFYDTLVRLKDRELPVESVAGITYLLSDDPTLDISKLPITDEINYAYLRGRDNLLNISDDKITVVGLTKGKETVLVLQSATKKYEVKVVLVDKLISTADEFKTIITNGLSNSYVVLTQDIDMGGIQLAGPTWTGTSGLTIDGRGHGIKNFTTMNMFGIDFQQMTFKNLVLDFQSLAWAEQYSGMFGNGGAQNVIMENVYLKVAFEKAAFSRGLFASRPSGMHLKNVVADVTLYGTGAGTVYADYNNFAGAGGDMTADSTLENVYVICSAKLSKKSDADTTKYGWDKLISGTSVNDITSIGGSFEKKEDGLYFGDKLVMLPKESVEITTYVLSSNPVLDIATLSLGDTIERAYLKGSTQLLPLENNQVTVNGLLTGADTTLVLQSATKNYEVNVIQADRLIATADDFKSIITSGLTNSYVVLTQDIDMGGIQLAGPTWTGTSGLTIDGRGHGIKNFTTMNMFGIDFQQMTFKNLVLDFKSLAWAEQYSGMFGNGGAQSVTMENVYLKVAFEKAAFSRGLFASRPSGMNLKNVVVEVSLYGTGAGTVYADYNNFAGAGGDMTADSTLENVYVICSAKLGKKSDTDTAKYGWNKLVSGTSISDITFIEGSFEKKEDGLYFYDQLVIQSKHSVKDTNYILSSNPILDIDKLSLDDTIESAYIKGSTKLLTIEKNKVTVSGLSKGTDTTLILQSATKKYEVNVVLADKLISTADEIQSIITSGLTNSYVVLTKDIDMGGIQLAGPVWTGTPGLTIDGRGHGIKNFTTMNMFGIDFQQMTFKNLVLDFKSLAWAEQYSGMFGNGGAQSVTMENVYLKVSFEKAAFSRGLFASRPSGMNLKNVIVDVSLYGTGAGTVYADYNNFAGAGGDMTADSTLENVYVICSTKLGKKSDTDTTKYGWDKLISGTSISDITSIGGFFEVKTDGLYFNEAKVK